MALGLEPRGQLARGLTCPLHEQPWPRVLLQARIKAAPRHGLQGTAVLPQRRLLTGHVLLLRRQLLTGHLLLLLLLRSFRVSTALFAGYAGTSYECRRNSGSLRGSSALFAGYAGTSCECRRNSGSLRGSSALFFSFLRRRVLLLLLHKVVRDGRQTWRTSQQCHHLDGMLRGAFHPCGEVEEVALLLQGNPPLPTCQARVHAQPHTVTPQAHHPCAQDGLRDVEDGEDHGQPATFLRDQVHGLLPVVPQRLTRGRLRYDWCGLLYRHHRRKARRAYMQVRARVYQHGDG